MSTPITETSFSIQNEHGDRVDGDVRFPAEANEPLPVVVMCHGFKGFKDWGSWPAWGRYLAEAGFASVLFNFSHNGVAAEEPTEFTELDKFAGNTFTRELSDVEAVLDATSEQRLPNVPLAPERLGLMGHSRGGGTAILQTARDERVEAVATWSSVSGLVERFSPEQIEQWKTQGYTEVVNSRTGQRMRMNRVLYDDAMEHRDLLDVQDAAARVNVPWLIVHATDDETVPFAEAEALAAQNQEADLFQAGGGHTFGGQHPPSEERPESLEAVFERTRSFFERTLR